MLARTAVAPAAFYNDVLFECFVLFLLGGAALALAAAQV